MQKAPSNELLEFLCRFCIFNRSRIIWPIENKSLLLLASYIRERVKGVFMLAISKTLTEVIVFLWY